MVARGLKYQVIVCVVAPRVLEHAYREPTEFVATRVLRGAVRDAATDKLIYVTLLPSAASSWTSTSPKTSYSTYFGLKDIRT